MNALPPLGRYVAIHHRSRLMRKLAGLCRRYLDWYGNLSYDLATNGEAFVMETLARFRPAVIFDVGANVGEWTALAARHAPQARIHCFEISPATFASLQRATASMAGVHCHNIGLSDERGSIRIRHYDGAPELTTSTAYPHPLPFTEIDCPVETGDSVAAKLGVSHIDVLKIDVEGMEERVLRGFGRMFDEGRIDVVQFEYGRVSILNHFLLADAYRFFEGHGFTVGKIFPRWVDFRNYDMNDEDFAGPNYLACRASRAGYLDALRGGR